MQLTNAQVAALRAFLNHDADSITPLAYQLGEEGMQGYVRLAEAALSIAARRRFSPRFTSADLVQYVASTRVSRLADGDFYDFDPVVGEEVLRLSLGQHARRTLEAEPRLRAVLALLGALAESELTSESDVDDVLIEARELADQWMDIIDRTR
jgi:hypothetical protein